MLDGSVLGFEILYKVLERVQCACRKVAKHIPVDGLKSLVSYPSDNLETTGDQEFYSQAWVICDEPSFVQKTAGFTPLMLAVLGAESEVTSILVQAGANIQRMAPCGFSALKLAKHNCNSLHPRELIWSNEWELKVFISLEKDLEILRILEKALEQRGELDVGDGELITTSQEAGSFQGKFFLSPVA
jgi:hypothetical protein